MDYSNDSTLNFTLHSEDEFYETVDRKDFLDEDAETIYEHLNKHMKLIPFGDYLKRYLFRIGGFTGHFNDVDLKEYQGMIIESFAENATPKSFTDTTAKLSALSKNWLTQSSVNRNVVFLLGFGLNMSVEDVSDFLVHAQRERNFNFKNPFEIICWYCYRKGYKFPKFVQLMDAYNDIPCRSGMIASDYTVGIRDMFMDIENEDELMEALARIKVENDGSFFSVTAKMYFDRLYDNVREIIAEKYTEDAQSDADESAWKYLDRIENSTALTFEEKNARAAKIRSDAKFFTKDDISEADVEKFLCCGVPFDGKGNLLKFSSSTLAKHFNNKRMSRQHIHDILLRKIDVDRFDLITLSFFIHAMDESEENNKKRYMNFVDDVNEMLEECYMGEMYITNPYECFLQMCMLSDWPMGAYSDVLEKSFEN